MEKRREDRWKGPLGKGVAGMDEGEADGREKSENWERGRVGTGRRIRRTGGKAEEEVTRWDTDDRRRGLLSLYGKWVGSEETKRVKR